MKPPDTIHEPHADPIPHAHFWRHLYCHLFARRHREARWPAVVSVLAVSGLYAALPESLSVGPRWLMAVTVLLFLLPTFWTRRKGYVGMNNILGYCLTGVITCFVVLSLVLLVKSLPTHQGAPEMLLRSSLSLWCSNVLVFALWYWRLDGGGPNRRDQRRGERVRHHGAFLFPQMVMDEETRHRTGAVHWSPEFVDYLFLAFNTSTALSPTDTAVLSRWAKLLMMVQSSISLAIVALLAARAVNIL